MRLILITLSALLLSTAAHAETFNFLMVGNTNDHASATAREKLCVMNAIEKEAQANGLKINIDILNGKDDAIVIDQLMQSTDLSDYNAILAPVRSSHGLSITKHIKTMPVIVTGTHPELNAQKNTVSMLNDDYIQAQIIADMVIEAGISEYGYINNLSDEYALFLNEQVNKILRTHAPDIKRTAIDMIDKSDINKIGAKVMESNPELLFMPLYNPSSAQLYNALARFEYKGKVIGSDSIGGKQSFFNIADTKGAPIDFVFLKHFHKPQGQFKADYRALILKHCSEYSVDSFISAMAYDTANRAIQAAKASANDAEFYQNLQTLPYNGVLSDTTTKGQKAMFVYRIADNKIELVKEIK